MIVDRAAVAAALPGIEIGGQVGAGAFGLVLAGRHRALNRDVAVKVLPASSEGSLGPVPGPGAAPQAGPVRVPAGRSGLQTEARLLASLDHPNIVRVYDYVETDDLSLIVMELLPGGTLAQRRAGMAPQTACAVALAVAAALSYAHERGVLHRDIKADNVLFDASGVVKVTDFGVAKLLDGQSATASAQVGTPMYMAPEQIAGGRLSPATDIYALGVLLYQLLAGAPPFDARQPTPALLHQHLTVIPPPPAGVPTPVAAVVLRALAKRAADRHPSARVFALDLAAAGAAAYGAGWPAHAGLPLRLDDDIREAAYRPPSPTWPTAEAAGTRPLADGALANWTTPTAGHVATDAITSRPGHPGNIPPPSNGGPHPGQPSGRPGRHRWAYAAAAGAATALVMALVVTLPRLGGDQGSPGGGTNSTTAANPGGGTATAVPPAATATLTKQAPGASAPLVSEDFSTSRLGPEWKVLAGSWRVENGALVGQADQTGPWPVIALSRDIPKDSVVSFRAKLTGDASLVELMMHLTNRRYVRAYLYSIDQAATLGDGTLDWDRSSSAGANPGGPTVAQKDFSIAHDRWYSLTITARGGAYTVAVDGTIVVEYDDPTGTLSQQGGIGFVGNGSTVLFDDLVVRALPT
ncbi:MULTISPECIES: protein kinase domain-containing protein [Pseudofrankia]|uniref:protein kinase domain-containing protein n=1 Tax=Pseudofrankia TaxID=2994363 RepID=UPI00030CE401|nr:MULTISPECIES: protein kinase [Pseudofrankia]OHV29722.1 hypothetical protein BCD49_35950 [Pseudofrankia sp. EUN1h]